MLKIITIGDEILIGQIVDTNSAWMATKLNEAGFEVSEIISIPDREAVIYNSLERALQESDIVLITGGLGPTKDDITKKTLADFFQSEMIFDEQVLQNIEQLFHGRSLVLNGLTRGQAMVPKACKVIQNRVGTAPVMWFEREGKIVVSMPGVPFEMKTTMENDVIPMLQQRFAEKSVVNQTVQVFGYGESALAEKIEEWENNLPDYLRLAYLPSLGVVKLRLSGSLKNGRSLQDEVNRQFQVLEKILGSAIFAKNDLSVEENLGIMLRNRGFTLSLAESCTGGKLAHRITAIPGSSDYFPGGVVSYHNDVKEEVLDVAGEILEKQGAVSKDVVEAMALGVKKLMKSDLAIAISGVAGPSGGTIEKPVGTVWIALAGKEKLESKKFQFGNYPREIIIERSATAAMLLLIEWLQNIPEKNIEC